MLSTKEVSHSVLWKGSIPTFLFLCLKLYNNFIKSKVTSTIWLTILKKTLLTIMFQKLCLFSLKMEKVKFANIAIKRLKSDIFNLSSKNSVL